MKNLPKILITLMLSVATLISNFAIEVPVAFALSCEDINNPEMTKDWIITVLEEQLGTPKSDAKVENGEVKKIVTEDVINCFRVTEPCAPDSKQSCSLYATTCTKDPSACNRVQIYYAQSGSDLIFSYAKRIYLYAAGIGGIFCVMYLIVGGIGLASSGGDSGGAEKGKAMITQSLMGLALLFLSALLLNFVNPNFFTR